MKCVTYLFQGLNEVHQMLETLPPGHLFEDPDFHADHQALFMSTSEHSSDDITWKRPYVRRIDIPILNS
jgi:hypothetical protein